MSQLLEKEQRQQEKEFNIHQETTSEIIRSYGKQFEQIQHRYGDGKNGRCVVGVLASYFGWDGKSKDDITSIRFHEKIDYLLDGKISLLELFELNDKEHKTFDEIADILQDNGS